MRFQRLYLAASGLCMVVMAIIPQMMLFWALFGVFWAFMALLDGANF